MVAAGDMAVVVEHSLSGLADLVAGAVGDGVSGWASCMYRLTWEAGTRTTLFVVGARPSWASAVAVLSGAVELCCEPAHEEVRVDGCQAMSHGAI